MASQLTMCKNDRCTNIVPESKNPGVKRVYCNTRCARRHHARLAYQREVGGDGVGMLVVDENMLPRVNRIFPRSEKLAEARFKAHNSDCVLAHGQDCAARFDVYDRKQLCLLHAVFNEDWGQWMAASQGKPFQRVMTTRDGYWQSDVRQLRGPEPLALPTKHGDESEEMIRAFSAAGGGTVSSVPDATAPWDEE